MMSQISEVSVVSNKRKLILGGLLLGLSMLCVVLTILFLYVSNTANQRVAEIRRDYRDVAARRDAQVDQLSAQVSALQRKLDAIPDRTASKTADKVKQVVQADEAGIAESGEK